MKKILSSLFLSLFILANVFSVNYTSVTDECPYIRFTGTTLQDILVHKTNMRLEKANGYVAVSFIGGDWQTLTWSSTQARAYGYSLDSLYDYILEIAKVQCDSTGSGSVSFSLSKNTSHDSIIAVLNDNRMAVKDSVGVAPTLTFAKNTGRDSIILTYGGVRTGVKDSSISIPTFSLSKNATRDSIITIFNGTRSGVKDSSIVKPTFTFDRNASRDSFVTVYDGTRTAVKDSFASSTVRKMDSIYRTAGTDSIIFKINTTRYAIKDSTGGSTGWGLSGNAGTSGYPSNFMGTTDNQNVIFKRNNAFICGLYANGLGVGINTSDNKYIEVQGSTTGNPATGYSFAGYGNYYTYSTNNYGFVHFNGGSKVMGIGVGTDGVTRIATGTNSGTWPVIYINEAFNGNGNVGIGASAITSAKLSVTSSTSGFLPPVMTSTQRDAISTPATGLMIFCSDCTATDASTGVTQTYNGSTWKNFW
mgnify:CR=1 FL=1